MAQDLGSLEKVLRLGEGRRIKRLQAQAEYVASLEPDFEQLSDEELAAKTVEFKQRYENGETLGSCSSRPTRPFARPPSARSASVPSTSR